MLYSHFVDDFYPTDIPQWCPDECSFNCELCTGFKHILVYYSHQWSITVYIYISHIHVIYMLYTCYIHVIYMLYTCCIHVIYIVIPTNDLLLVDLFHIACGNCRFERSSWTCATPAALSAALSAVQRAGQRRRCWRWWRRWGWWLQASETDLRCQSWRGDIYIYICTHTHIPATSTCAIFCLFAKSTNFQPLKIKKSPGSFLEQEKCPWIIIPKSYLSSFIPSCERMLQPLDTVCACY